jgi:hypothetical protein
MVFLRRRGRTASYPTAPAQIQQFYHAVLRDSLNITNISLGYSFIIFQ